MTLDWFGACLMPAVYPAKPAWFCRLMDLFHQVGITRCENSQSESSGSPCQSPALGNGCLGEIIYI